MNGELVGDHTGGYSRFSFDITKLLNLGEANELVVYVLDPTETVDGVALGKQRINYGGITYTSCSGIWGSVKRF